MLLIGQSKILSDYLKVETLWSGTDGNNRRAQSSTYLLPPTTNKGNVQKAKIETTNKGNVQTAKIETTNKGNVQKAKIETTKGNVQKAKIETTNKGNVQKAK